MHQAIENTQNYVAQTYKRAPFVLHKGQGAYVWDTDGRRYLDMVSGIAVMSLGHSDPQVVDIIRRQADQLVHVSNLYYTEAQAELAKALCERSFAERVFFCNSGAEANEACIKFARKFAYAHGQSRPEIIAFSHAFHGRTMGALSLTPKPAYQDPFRPLMDGATILPVNDSEAFLGAMSERVCAVIVEPIQGEGGVRPVEADFLRLLRETCDRLGALLIFDEVQCGLGRTGTLWAHEGVGVTPDLMSLAKPLAAGLPIGAVLMSERVHQALAAGDHGSTFAGGPLVCTVAKHVLERIAEPAFLAHVREVADYLWERLAEINSPHIVEIRGRGLMVGVELDFPVTELIDGGYQQDLLLVGAGPNTLRLLPPLIVQKSDVDFFIERLTALLAAKA